MMERFLNRKQVSWHCYDVSPLLLFASKRGAIGGMIEFDFLRMPCCGGILNHSRDCSQEERDELAEDGYFV